MLFHTRKTVFFFNGESWVKTSGLFGVSMGAFDGAEVSNLVGLYLLNEMRKRFPQLTMGSTEMTDSCTTSATH